MSDSTERGLVVVTGASSQIGVFLLPRLVESGFRVQAVSRRAAVKPLVLESGPVWMSPEDALKPETHSTESANWLISAGPASLASQLLERNPRFNKVVQFTTTSILTKSQSANTAERDLVNRIVRQETRLKDLCARHNVPLVILRPTLIYGCGMDKNLTRLWHWGNRTGFIPVASQSDGLRQPVHADDLAGLAAGALVTETGSLLESAACGGSTLSYREMAEATARSCARKTRVVAVPTGLFATGVRVLSWSGAAGVNPEMVYRQALDMVFEDSILREKLDYRPRPFQPTAQDFSVAAQLAGFQLPD